MTTIHRIVTALASAFAAAAAANAGLPFLPETAPERPAVAEIQVVPGRLMPLVKCKVDGRDAVMIFDTGATHTTFDVGFVKRVLPGTKFEKVVLGGVTNVAGEPSLFHVSSLKVGEAEFGDFDAMALDLSHFAPEMAGRIDGIVGMNIIGRVATFVSLGSRRVVFSPGDDVRRRFGKMAKRRRDDPFSVALDAVVGEKKFTLIVDSASSFTFLDATLGWPSTGRKETFNTLDVNGGGGLSAERGKPGPLALGEDVGIVPLLVRIPMNRIGADTLLKYDMLVDFGRVGFCKMPAHEADGKAGR